MADGPINSEKEPGKLSRRQFLKGALTGAAVVATGAGFQETKAASLKATTQEVAEATRQPLKLATFQVETETGRLFLPGVEINLLGLGVFGEDCPTLHCMVIQEETTVASMKLADVNDIVGLRRMPIKSEKPEWIVPLVVLDDDSLATRAKRNGIVPLNGKVPFKDKAVFRVIVETGKRSLNLDDAGNLVVDYGDNYRTKTYNLEEITPHVHNAQSEQVFGMG